MTRNENFSRLSGSYLFPEIARRRKVFEQENPSVRVISLGIGNTTEPLPREISMQMADYARALSTKSGYHGYGPDYGEWELRSAIAQKFYKSLDVSPQEVYISDGAKCDIARIQALFGGNVAVSVQDPAYPVYVDGSIIAGCKNFTLLPCTAENNFFPDLTAVQDGSLIYFCSPNNPTGVASSKSQLAALVNFANSHKCIIIFDAAYSQFIRNTELPHSIYEIKGSKTCAIEVNSFSKPAGFTGVRLGWSVVPKELLFDGGESVANDWARVQTTLFNGASNIAQAGGITAMSEAGTAAMRKIIDFYLENALMIEKALSFGLGGTVERVHFTGDSPYLWVKFADKMTSWQAFDLLLSKYNIVTTPGSGFGACGEGYLRFSSFGHRDEITAACERLAK